MSAKSSAETPDAWEDDWERQADTLASDPTPPPPEKKVSSKVTKAQRRAQQAEFNRQLWAEAESPQTFHYLESHSNVPLKQEFKPTVTLLSRNPQPSRQSSSVNATTAGLGRLGLNGDNDDESDDDNNLAEPSPEERQAIALRNLEEKQRKYEEARQRLFGTPSATTSGASSPRSGTPPKHEGRRKGRNRGNGRDTNRDKRDSSAASGKSRQLYDPGSPKPSYVQRKEKQSMNDPSGNGQQSPQQPIRSPRGPDSSGRGGFRSGSRGARAT
ncbi:hypothetical protein BDV28DRAFT_63024 [Aspergillus coremiiformis]|uniref:Uncharacterized protein n=1 Tax=Aspergillus coremiiformis TaxID=138285 RepID=A0A5N6YV73_9EURO|nr:hypothetical protein BDV28DRAFT_63024 [Aspergillus coremiiformis]